MRVAIIGYGLAGAVFHAPLVAATEGLDVVTIVTGNPERRCHAQQDHPGARVVATVEEVWGGEHDLVAVATPNDTHAPLAREAIDRGIAVLVDKPLALSASEARELVRHGGDRLTVFQNRRWDSDQLTLRRLLAEGVLGEVTRHETRLERWRPEPRPDAWRDTRSPEEGGGVLLDLGSHLVDEVLTVLGPATHVHAEVDARRGGAADDDAFLALRHESGAYSHVRASAVTAAPGPRLRVLGTAAAFVVDEMDGQEDALRDGLRPGRDEPWGVEPPARWGRLVRGEDSEPVPSEPGAWPEFYAAVERWLRSRGAPPVDPWDAVRVLEVVEAARRSAAERSVVAL
jgi:scyllo-inositol 2-dehydrogenase (NADP+)